MFKKIIRNPQAVVGLILILLVVFAALTAPVLAPNAPELVDTTKKYMAPCAEYPLGTDQLGRCELSRLIYGARYSLGISLPVLAVLAILGLVLGTFSICAGEKTDRVLTIICDTFLSFPSLVIAVAVRAAWKRCQKHCHSHCRGYVGLVYPDGPLLCGGGNGKGLHISSENQRLRNSEINFPAFDTEYSSPIFCLSEYGHCLVDTYGFQFCLFGTGASGRCAGMGSYVK